VCALNARPSNFWGFLSFAALELSSFGNFGNLGNLAVWSFGFLGIWSFGFFGSRSDSIISAGFKFHPHHDEEPFFSLRCNWTSGYRYTV